MSMVKDGDGDREATGAVEEVTEGQVEDEDGGASLEPRELALVPATLKSPRFQPQLLPKSCVEYCQYSDQVASGSNDHDGHSVEDEEPSLLLDLFRLTRGKVSSSWGEITQWQAVVAVTDAAAEASPQLMTNQTIQLQHVPKA